MKKIDNTQNKVQKLSLDMLENVSGGVLTENLELFLDENKAIQSIYTPGMQKDEFTTKVLQEYDNQNLSEMGLTKQDMRAYIDDIWPIL